MSIDYTGKEFRLREANVRLNLTLRNWVLSSQQDVFSDETGTKCLAVIGSYTPIERDDAKKIVKGYLKEIEDKVIDVDLIEVKWNYRSRDSMYIYGDFVAKCVIKTEVYPTTYEVPVIQEQQIQQAGNPGNENTRNMQQQ